MTKVLEKNICNLLCVMCTYMQFTKVSMGKTVHTSDDPTLLGRIIRWAAYTNLNFELYCK